MGHNLDQQDKLDAIGLAMIASRRSGYLACDRASTAVEFALVLPALAALVVGGLYTGLVVYSAAGLHSAVEQAARCYSVNVTQCNSASATQTYAQSQYYGINSPTFTASTQSCGHQVAATVTVEIVAVLADLSVPLSATACFP
jgi:Flp pilus assembly protein TadG